MEKTIKLRGYRVLKAFGAWGYGEEFWSAQTASMNQAVRRGVLERIPDSDHRFPASVVEAMYEKPSHKAPAKKKAKPAVEPVDGPSSV